MRRLALLVALGLVVAGCDRPAPSQPIASTAPSASPAPAAPPAPQPEPPAAALDWHTITSADGGFTVRYAVEPDPIVTRDPFAITVELFEDSACTKPLRTGTLSVDAAMPEHGHGMNVRPKITEQGPGSYRVVGMLFHMAGRWELFFDRTLDGQTERAQTTVRLDLTN